MAKLKKSYCFSMGEGHLRGVPEKKRIELNNTKLTRYRSRGFIFFLMSKGRMKKPVNVIFSEKKTKRSGITLWGLCLPWCRTIKLYRQSVWIFLHELSHLYEPLNAGHNHKFAKRLKMLYQLWTEFTQPVGVQNAKKKKRVVKRGTGSNHSRKIS